MHHWLISVTGRRQRRRHFRPQRSCYVRCGWTQTQTQGDSVQWTKDPFTGVRRGEKNKNAPSEGKTGGSGKSQKSNSIAGEAPRERDNTGCRKKADRLQSTKHRESFWTGRTVPLDAQGTNVNDPALGPRQEPGAPDDGIRNRYALTETRIRCAKVEPKEKGAL